MRTETRCSRYIPLLLVWRGHSCPRYLAASKAKGDDRIPSNACRFLKFCQELGFQIVWIRPHFTRKDFFVRGALKAQFTHAQSFLVPNWRAKHAAGHWPRLIEVAVAGLRIESGARLVVRKILK